MCCRRSGPARWGHLTLAQRGSRRARARTAVVWGGEALLCWHPE